MLAWIKKLFGSPVDIKAMLDQGAIILDVRTKAEFKSGHVNGSVNIPLQQLSGQLNKLRAKDKPILACCATGNRSGQAARMLRARGIEAYNAGSWRRVVPYTR